MCLQTSLIDKHLTHFFQPTFNFTKPLNTSSNISPLAPWYFPRLSSRLGGDAAGRPRALLADAPKRGDRGEVRQPHGRPGHDGAWGGILLKKYDVGLIVGLIFVVLVLLIILMAFFLFHSFVDFLLFVLTFFDNFCLGFVGWIGV